METTNKVVKDTKQYPVEIIVWGLLVMGVATLLWFWMSYVTWGDNWFGGSLYFNSLRWAAIPLLGIAGLVTFAIGIIQSIKYYRHRVKDTTPKPKRELAVPNLKADFVMLGGIFVIFIILSIPELPVYLNVVFGILLFWSIIGAFLAFGGLFADEEGIDAKKKARRYGMVKLYNFWCKPYIVLERPVVDIARILFFAALTVGIPLIIWFVMTNTVNWILAWDLSGIELSKALIAKNIVGSCVFISGLALMFVSAIWCVKKAVGGFEDEEEKSSEPQL